jgi:GTP cyclohydrolase II
MRQVLGSCKCDCRQQLDFALEAIDAEPRGGVVIYMQQACPRDRHYKLATRACRRDRHDKLVTRACPARSAG